MAGMEPESNLLIERLEARVADPRQGLPSEVFLFLSRMSPLTNVDLLIQDEAGRTLLTWRDDEFHPGGWHVPGGIIRYKETMAERIRKVAFGELGTEVEFSPNPIAVNEVIAPVRRDRGHFLSLLFRCRLLREPSATLAYGGTGMPRAGEWAWHLGAPADLIEVHRMYLPAMAYIAPGVAP